MGNCLVMENKVIKIMRNDGKVVEYKGPMKVHHILTQFSPHYSLFDSLSNNCHLHPQAKLLCGRLYYLLPMDTSSTIKTIKKVRFANPEVEKQEEQEQEQEQDSFIGSCDNTMEKTNGFVRVKMVVSKQELEKLLEGGSVHDMVYRTLAKQHLCDDDDGDGGEDDECHKGWRPLLDSIPETD
ncbi:hypothetical protein CARUB_v10027215mg [Capsella rubella]|uniref:DUF4228 domain protein n=1 Tax=Capsella rubella TaxID=81985 RepID=R0GSD7_9BRAS|nr:uncharacterized protein LOC17875164 [Capsella rubella]EOA14078.1 hypothetical protein CARUB_v10027215mg [Capsella rubella]